MGRRPVRAKRTAGTIAAVTPGAALVGTGGWAVATHTIHLPPTTLMISIIALMVSTVAAAVVKILSIRNSRTVEQRRADTQHMLAKKLNQKERMAGLLALSVEAVATNNKQTDVTHLEGLIAMIQQGVSAPDSMDDDTPKSGARPGAGPDPTGGAVARLTDEQLQQMLQQPGPDPPALIRLPTRLCRQGGRWQASAPPEERHRHKAGERKVQVLTGTGPASRG